MRWVLVSLRDSEHSAGSGQGGRGEREKWLDSENVL